MKYNRFHPSRVRVPNQLEEVLLRIVIAHFESPVPGLVYLAELCCCLNPAGFPLDWLDVPLSKLAGLVEEELATHPTARKPAVSAHAVAIYLADLRQGLERSCHGRAPLGERTLRELFPHNTATALKKLSVFASRRILRVWFDWWDAEVFGHFFKARWTAVRDYFQGHLNDKNGEVDELAGHTFFRVFNQIGTFNSRRATFMGFTMGKAKWILREFRKEAAIVSAQQISLDEAQNEERESSSLLDTLAAEPAPEGWDDDETSWRLRLSETLFNLRQPRPKLIVCILNHWLDFAPSMILGEFGDKPMRDVVAYTELEYLLATRLPLDHVQNSFTNIRAWLDQRLGSVVSGPVHRTKLRRWLSKRMGDIPLKRFFPAKNDGDRRRKLTEASNYVYRELVLSVRRKYKEKLPAPASQVRDSKGISQKSPRKSKSHQVRVTGAKDEVAKANKAPKKGKSTASKRRNALRPSTHDRSQNSRH